MNPSTNRALTINHPPSAEESPSASKSRRPNDPYLCTYFLTRQCTHLVAADGLACTGFGGKDAILALEKDGNELAESQPKLNSRNNIFRCRGA